MDRGIEGPRQEQRADDDPYQEVSELAASTIQIGVRVDLRDRAKAQKGIQPTPKTSATSESGKIRPKATGGLCGDL